MYLIAGVLAVVAAIYFISTADQAGDSFGILDYAILGMGVVAVYRGARGFLDLRRGDSGSTGSASPSAGRTGSATPSAGPTRIRKPGSGPSDDPDETAGSGNS